MLQQSINRQYAYGAIAVLILIWTWVLIRPTSTYDAIKSLALSGTTGKTHSAQEPVTPEFEYEPFDPRAIQAVCETTEWTPGLVFTCDESVGGIGNIRNSILHCMRYAIEAGAAFVLPHMVKRSDDNIDVIRQDVHVDFEYMFNKEHYLNGMREACPQMYIYTRIEDIPNHGAAGDKLALLPEALALEEGNTQAPNTGIPQPGQWREKFYTWLHAVRKPSPELPIIVALQRSYLSFPIRYDVPDFYLNFGLVLKFRPDVYRLADKVLLELGRRYNITMDLSVPVQPSSFFGVHLRLEHDALVWGGWEWGKFEKQVPAYLEQTKRSKISVIYVASGDNIENAKFADAAREQYSLPVTTKFQCLYGEDFEMLKSMYWDQQALVDFLVMLRATDFAGVGHSSFAWNVALKRHRYSEVRNPLDKSQIYEDELSVIYSGVRQYPEYDACMWP